METRVSLYLVIDNETGKGEVQANVSQWDGPKLTYNAKSHRSSTMAAPIRPDQSVLPYLVATLANHTDLVISQLRERIAAGEILLMHEVEWHQL